MEIKFKVLVKGTFYPVVELLMGRANAHSAKYYDPIKDELFSVVFHLNEDIHLCPYTGLKDNYGKDIYLRMVLDGYFTNVLIEEKFRGTVQYSTEKGYYIYRGEFKEDIPMSSVILESTSIMSISSAFVSKEGLYV